MSLSFSLLLKSLWNSYPLIYDELSFTILCPQMVMRLGITPATQKYKATPYNQYNSTTNNLQTWPWSSPPFHRRKSSLIWNNPNWPDQAFILETNIGSHFQISRSFLMLLLRALNYIRFYFLTWAEGYGNGNLAFYKLKQLNNNLISQPLCCNVKTRTAAKIIAAFSLCSDGTFLYFFNGLCSSTKKIPIPGYSLRIKIEKA